MELIKSSFDVNTVFAYSCSLDNKNIFSIQDVLQCWLLFCALSECLVSDVSLDYEESIEAAFFSVCSRDSRTENRADRGRPLILLVISLYTAVGLLFAFMNYSFNFIASFRGKFTSVSFFFINGHVFIFFWFCFYELRR